MYRLINVLPVWEAGISKLNFLESIASVVNATSLFNVPTPFAARVDTAGTGIGIRINDDGVDFTHDEFSGKFSVDASCSVYAPALLDAQHTHGTTCASLAAGNGGADSPCAVGIALGATLSACRVVPERALQSDIDVALEAIDYSFLYDRMENMHVSSNSFGIDPCRRLPAIEWRERRRLQLSRTKCPFTSNSTASPCLEPSCAGVDCGSPTLSSTTTAVATNTTCASYVSVYCRLLFEGDVDACTGYVELSVQCDYNPQAQEQLDAMAKGINEGRDGKGIIYIFAAGNTYSSGSDVNFEGALNSRYAISVGATGKDGTHASYSIRGAPLFVSAPGGDFDTYTNNIVALAGGGCAEGGVGTNFAAPIVSGVVALILEANLDLSWRDVQGIFAQTSRQVESDDESWTTNSAGFHHSYAYGFGLVDAEAAVTAAETWALFSPEIQFIVTSNAINLTIPDFQGGPAASSLTLESLDTFLVESVIVFLDMTHSSRGDLEIVLTSPSGTASILAPGQRPENSQATEEWKLMTVRNWGEPANGEWTLSLVDPEQGDLSPCVDLAGWTVVFDVANSEELGCDDFRRVEICVNGAEGPGFSTFFSDSVSSITDPMFTNTDGVSVKDACCVCGGGLLASTLTNVLHSWTLAVYGHDGSIDGSALTTTPAPVPNTVADSTASQAPFASASNVSSIMTDTNITTVSNATNNDNPSIPGGEVVPTVASPPVVSPTKMPVAGNETAAATMASTTNTPFQTTVNTAIEIPSRMSNDPNDNGSDETVTVITFPLNGALNVDSTDGIITYVPVDNFIGKDDFSLEICTTLSTGQDSCRLEQLTVTVVPLVAARGGEDVASSSDSGLYYLAILVLLPVGAVVVVMLRKRSSSATAKGQATPTTDPHLLAADTSLNHGPAAMAMATSSAAHSSDPGESENHAPTAVAVAHGAEEVRPHYSHEPPLNQQLPPPATVTATALRTKATPAYKDQCRWEPNGVRLQAQQQPYRTDANATPIVNAFQVVDSGDKAES